MISEEKRGQLTTFKAIRTYVFGKHGTITFVSKKSGDHFTYKFSAPKSFIPSQDRADVVYVGVLTGPENTKDFTPLGLVAVDKQNRHTFRRTRISPISIYAPSSVAFRWFTQFLLDEHSEVALAQCEVWQEGVCGRCGRKLTHEESIERGLGPECAKKE